MQKIEDVVNKVLEAMRLRGLGEYTLKCVNWSIYRSIVNWHYKHGTEYYSEELLEDLCKQQEARYMQGEISRKFYRSFVTASFRIRSYVDTGAVDFSIVKDARWFRPNQENQKITDAILESTGLKDGYQRKLSIPIRHLFCFMEERGKVLARLLKEICLILYLRQQKRTGTIWASLCVL